MADKKDLPQAPNPQTEDDLDLQFGPVVDENLTPGMPELWSSIESQPVPPDAIQQLRQSYYPNFDDDQIALIEHTIRFSFEKFLSYTRWAFSDQVRQPTIDNFGCDSSASFADRLTAIATHRVGTANTAFATLDDVEGYLQIPGQPGLVDRIDVASASGPTTVVDIGCGGQTVDILLLADPRLVDRDIRIVGTGVFDYGQQLRPAFPEVNGRLEFVSDNILSTQIPPQSADFVFSTRTVPYTGVIDPVRFCDNASSICRSGGTILIGEIEESSFSFSGTEYSNLAGFLEAQRQRMPSLVFHQEGSRYSVSWTKDDGSPFEGLVAKDMLYNDQQQPYSIRYGI